MPHTNTFLSGIVELTSRILLKVETWLEISRQRRTLATLDDRLLKDIGISRASANAEANRPFWDVPEETSRQNAQKEPDAPSRGQKPGEQVCYRSYVACA